MSDGRLAVARGRADRDSCEDVVRHDVLPQDAILYGPGSHRQVGHELERRKLTGVVVFTIARLTACEVSKRLKADIGARLRGWRDHFKAHVPVGGVTEAAQQVGAAQADTIVAFGGGRVIDAAKAVSDRLHDQGQARPIILAIPTTLSGSEFAHYYGVSEPRGDGPFKRSHASRATTPAAVFLDPEATVETPPVLWASSGIKALDHAIEGLLSPGSRPLVDPVALAGIARMVDALPRSNGDLAARLQCQIAAWQCYSAPAAIRLGLSHRIGHMLGGTFGVPHGLTSGVTLPAVLRLYADIEPDKVRMIARALGATCSDPGERQAADQLEALVRQLGLPTRLRDLGLAHDQVPQLRDRVIEHATADIARLGLTGYHVLNACCRASGESNRGVTRWKQIVSHDTRPSMHGRGHRDRM